MHHPVQRLLFCPATTRLYTGTGGVLAAWDAISGAHLAEWHAPSAAPPAKISKKQKAAKTNTTTTETSTKDNAPVASESIALPVSEETAARKRKADEEAAVTSPTPVTEAAEPAAKKPKTDEPTPVPAIMPKTSGWDAKHAPNTITHLALTSSGRHLITATNEDKTIRVFSVPITPSTSTPFQFTLLSERQMPKRPCALKIIESLQNLSEVSVEEEQKPNTVTIICADKFGDVYSLPLINVPRLPKADATPNPAHHPATPKIAGGGVITTKRNQVAALKAAEMGGRDSVASLEARELPFEHTLLLGHVSLLLDVLPITLQVDVDGKQVKRTWILSADKDEHIRVSRYPKSYVIEGFCMGHKGYVGKLLAPSWEKGVLISGGGDDWLGVWDWRKGQLTQKVELRAIVDEVVKERGVAKEDDGEFQISVGGLWEIGRQDGGAARILVAVERYV